MIRALRSVLCALAVVLAPACGQMGPLVVPEKSGNAEPAGPPAVTPTATTPEQKELQPESAPLQVP